MILCIIPVRLESKRFPGKALADVGGVPMFIATANNARVAGFDKIAIASDNIGVLEIAHAHGFIPEKTSSLHASGTTRCFEAASRIVGADNCTVMVNLQADELFMPPEVIRKTTDTAIAGPWDAITTSVGTLCHNDLEDENTVKAVVSHNGWCLYFSRLPVKEAYKHHGIYAFAWGSRRIVGKYADSPLARAESLEQMNWLDGGAKIRAVKTDLDFGAVNTPADIEKWKR